MLKRFVKYRFLRILLRCLLGLFIFFVALVLWIRSPWGQSIIVSEAVDYIAAKTQTRVSIDKLFLTFSGNLELDGLYLEDQQQDTLLYSESLEISVALMPLIRSDAINVKGLYWHGFKARIKRPEAEAPVNYDFLITAFVPAEDSLKQTPEEETSLPVNIGKISLKQFDLQYKDALTGMDAAVKLGQLELLPGALDVDQMDFTIESLLVANSEIFYRLTQPPTQIPPTTAESTSGESVLPTLRVSALKLEGVQLDYESVPDQTTALIKVGDMQLRNQQVDLVRQKVSLDEFAFNNSELFLKQLSEDAPVTADSTEVSEPVPFSWPEWYLDIQKVSLRNNRYQVQLTDSVPEPGVFDPANISLSQADLVLHDISLKPGTAHLKLDQLSFVERSGFELKRLGFDVDLDDQRLAIGAFNLSTPSNFLSGDTELNFASLQALLDDPKTSSASLKLDSILINPGEFLPFSPDLSTNEPFQALTQKPLRGKLDVAGSLAAIELNDLALQWGDNTNIRIMGAVKNPADTSSLAASLEKITIASNRADTEILMMGEDPGMKIPQSFRLEGSLSGGFDQGETSLRVSSSLGGLNLSGKFTRGSAITLEANVQVKDLLLHELLANQQLDTLSLALDLNAKGTSLNDITAQFKGRFQKLRFDGYDYSALRVDGNIQKGEGTVDLELKDQNLDLALQTQLLLDSLRPRINSLLTVNGADLQALGLTEEPIRTAFTLSTDVTGNTDDLRADLKLRNGKAVYDQEAYTFGDFDLNARATHDTLFALVNSRMMDARVVSNRNVDKLLPALQQQMDYYLNGRKPAESPADDGAVLEASVTFRLVPVISEVFLQSMERLDTVTMRLNYDQNAHSLNASLLAPHITYQGSEVDSVKFDLKGDSDGLDLRAGWSEINAGSVSIDEGLIRGALKEGTLDSRITVFEDTTTFLSMGSVWTLGDTLSMHISDEALIFNKKNWSVLKENELTLMPDRIAVKDFELTNGNQTLALSDQMPGSNKAHIAALFENYQLSNLIGFLNPGKPLAKGIVNGSFIVEEPLAVPGLIAGLTITDLEAMEIPLGKLTLEAKATGAKDYDLALGLEGKEVNMKMAGEYQNSNVASELDLRLDINSLQTSLLQKFSQEQLSEAQGNISGELDIRGDSDAPIYQGQINFNKVSFLVKQLNTAFSMDQERLKLDNKGLHFQAFTIADGDRNTFDIDGSILTSELTNPEFDLSLVAKGFTPVNSTRADSDFFYGQVSVNTDLDITGNLQIPKVRGRIQVIDGSSMTVIVPESELELKAREGVVVFVNRKNPDDILTRPAENEPSALGEMLAGFDIETVLEIGRNTEFNIIIDEQRGDNIKVQGTGSFNMGLEPNGRTRMSGQYNLSGGHLEVGLYGLVGRRFEIVPGGNITWLGDPLEARLNMRALYKLNISAGPLMAERTTSDAQIEAAYRQKLPFEVYINVDGMLLKPEISFNLDMPEDERGALGGAVYNQIERLNSQEEELTKQVFSLLVLGGFYTSKGSDGSSGGPASLAIDNVSSILEGQLNNYSDKLFDKTGLQLGVDINNRTDQQGNRATSVDISAQKEFFNDRLIVRVGSEVDVAGGQSSSQGTPIIGNVSVEYLITRDRRLRLRGFNKNTYEGIIDGQLTVSGIALIFSREFNKFKELWIRQMRKEEKTKNTKKK